MNIEGLEKRVDYDKDSEITRADAWADFKHDWGRVRQAACVALYGLYHIGHAGVVGQAVNGVRMALGASVSRDGSQTLAKMLLLAGFLVGVAYAVA